MKNVAFHTLGCKVNQYETEAMQELFENKGYKIVDFQAHADIYIINTCTVTNIAAKKSRQMISKAHKKNPRGLIAVVGCYSQMSADKVRSLPGVDIVIGTDHKNKILEYIEQYEYENKKQNYVFEYNKKTNFESLQISKIKDKTRAYIKIQDGCNQFCSYCIIPYARGRVRSRPMKEVIEEVKRIVENGYQEIILTGIHVTSYGDDLRQGTLTGLIEELNKISGLERIRLSSMEPTYITQDFISRMKHVPKLCKHFHLSLQSGCNKVLKEMNRRYTTEQYFNSVQLLRDLYKDAAITTDIIVGYPGETKEDFQITYEYVKKVLFSEIHVFKYSPREGTKAANRKDQISPSVKDARCNALLKLGKDLQNEFLFQQLGKVEKVLIEKYNEENKGYEGYTSNYCKVMIPSLKEIKLEGKIVKTKLLTLEAAHIVGRIE